MTGVLLRGIVLVEAYTLNSVIKDFTKAEYWCGRSIELKLVLT